MWGFFFRYEHTAKLRINFTLDEQYFREEKSLYLPWVIGDEKEKLHLVIEGLGSVFSYETVSNHNEKLTAVLNDNLIDTPGAICYEGTVSMYPGRRDQWDAITVWEVDSIVAWAGRFYKALNPNANSEPPSADWSVL